MPKFEMMKSPFWGSSFVRATQRARLQNENPLPIDSVKFKKGQIIVYDDVSFVIVNPMAKHGLITARLEFGSINLFVFHPEDLTEVD